jgi:hypothetical protein
MHRFRLVVGLWQGRKTALSDKATAGPRAEWANLVIEARARPMKRYSRSSLVALFFLLGCSNKNSAALDRADSGAAAPEDAAAESAAGWDVGAAAEAGGGCDPGCPLVRNGASDCVEGRCRVRCASGTKQCLGSCVFNEDPCSEYLTCPPQNPVWCAGVCVGSAADSCCSLQRCGAFACRENRCLTACSGDGDCAVGHSCMQGQCGPCGHRGEPCCWDAGQQRYDCSESMVTCRLTAMKCEPLVRL